MPAMSLSAAIGLGMGWGIPVSGCSSMAIIAAALFAERPALDRCAIALTGGHGELFVQRFAAKPLIALSDLASLPPEEAAGMISERVVAGSGAAALAGSRGLVEPIDMLPVAAAAGLLPIDWRMLDPRPIYGRAPDARPAAA
jgi:tRNA threonylcarbamoyladenosine biosynthesis protein TsaB